MLTLGVIGLATLRPDPVSAKVPPRPESAAPSLNLADSIRNLLLFAPAGAAAAVLGWRPAAVAGAALALSASVEGAQLLLPGRDPTLRDVATNGGGALLGALLVVHARWWLRPTARAERGLAAAALACVLGVAAGSGALLAPAPTGLPFFGHRVPDLGHLAAYDGHLDAARVSAIDVPHGELAEAPALRAALRHDFRVAVEGRAGATPDGLAAFLLVTDAHREEIFLLGPEDDDLLFRFRSLGRAVGLEPTRARRSGLLAGLEPGDPLRAQATRTGADLCLVLNEDERCGLGPTVADAWMLVLPAMPAIDRLRGLLGVAWIAALLAPIGYWAAPRRDGVLLWVGAGLGLVLLPPLTGLLPTPIPVLAVAVAALVAGRALRIWIEATA